MSARFADSFCYLALLNRRDVSHDKALALSERLGGGTATTAWVLTEVADALSDAGQRGAVVRLVETLRADPGCLIVPVSEDLFERGWDLYAHRPDKNWSLTDCISFVVMRQHEIAEALTADRHFEQAGFAALFR